MSQQMPVSRRDVRSVFRAVAWQRGRRLSLALAVCGFGGHQIAEVLVPVAVGFAIDHAISAGDPTALAWSVVVLAVVFAALITAWQTGDRSGMRVFAFGEHGLRQRILIAAFARNGAARRPTGEVLTISATDSAAAAGIMWTIAEVAAATAAVSAAIVSLVLIAWPLAAAVMIITVGQLLLIRSVARRLERRSYAAQQRAAHLDTIGTDLASGLRVLDTLGGTSNAVRRYIDASRAAATAAYITERTGATISGLNTFVSGIAFTGLTFAAGWFTVTGAVSVGGFITVIGLAQTIRWPLQALSELPAQIAAKHGSARRIAELIIEPPPPQAAPSMPSTLDVSAVPSVRFVGADGRIWATKEHAMIGIRCADSDAAAMLGALNGATLSPPETLLIRGADSRALPADLLRRTVFAPPHASAVFTGSVQSNIAETISPEHLVTAAFDEVLDRLPRRLDEPIGEGGMRLSGGQRQRLLLARALHQTHPVLVLHEPTTALDPVTERRVAQNLAGSARTIVVITDRPTLLEHCSVVYDLRRKAGPANSRQENA
ncbi:ABC transporter transmembrane domain-containing protein [Curtobacterium sp. ME12]|uniref:ABC transporter transmembrane domain-containing protein n=1 Tax=Curtobacterium sp. ME12 TaxID=2744253 RepID=UPI0015F59F19|nr:ABC transporter ATP-binding protein [Curtobacterium sp. ME12]